MGQKIKNVFCGIYDSIKVSFQASRPVFLLRLLLEAIGAVLPILVAYIQKEVIDGLTNQFKLEFDTIYHKVLSLIVLLLLVEIGQMIIARLKDVFAQWHQDVISNHIELKVINKINDLDISFFDNAKFYDEVLNASRDSQSLQALALIGVGLIKGVVQAFSCYIIIGDLHWSLPLIIILLNLPGASVDRRYLKKYYLWQRERAKQERRMNYIKFVLRSKQHAKEIRIFETKSFFLDWYHKLWNEYFRDKQKLVITRNVVALVTACLPVLFTSFIYIMLVRNILVGELSVGSFTYYVSIIGQYMSGVGGVITSCTKIYEHEMKLENFKKFMCIKPLVNNTGKLEIDKIESIEFDHVSFAYPNTNRLILDDISFGISAREKIALVGVNGAGKTTIIKLLLRLYDVNKGVIRVNGKDIRDYDISSYRKALGLVLQDYCNYALTLRENIGISDVHKLNSTEDNIYKKCCEQTNLELQQELFTKGLDTYLTKEFNQDGVELSTGQWQKIAIARAYFRESSLMIMDEPSASLDPEAENQVFQSLVHMSSDKVAIFITHRFSNATLADRIIVIEDGRITEQGSHTELMDLNGTYHRLFTLQAEKYQEK